jgi:hypothetical protein
MRNTTLLTALLLLGVGGVARAGGQSGSIGVGIEQAIPGFEEADFGAGAVLTGNTALSVNFDGGKFHAGGFLGFQDPAGQFNTFFTIGGRFYYHVHSTAMADFGIGGQLGIGYRPTGQMMDRYDTDIFIEPGFQIRAFLASNVAISFTAGMVIGAVDASGIELGGQVQGAAGVHYYFF